MNKNVGGVDRLLRIVVGVALIGLALGGTAVGIDTGYNVWGWVGVIPLVTGLFNFCPFYPILGIKTCKTE